MIYLILMRKKKCNNNKYNNTYYNRDVTVVTSIIINDNWKNALLIINFILFLPLQQYGNLDICIFLFPPPFVWYIKNVFSSSLSPFLLLHTLHYYLGYNGLFWEFQVETYFYYYEQSACHNNVERLLLKIMYFKIIRNDSVVAAFLL